MDLLAASISRVVDEISGAFNEEGLKKLLALKADAALVERLDQLGEKANEGQLTDRERDEYLCYITFSEFLGVLQARARKALSRATAA